VTDNPGAPWEKRPTLEEETFSPLLPQPPSEGNTRYLDTNSIDSNSIESNISPNDLYATDSNSLEAAENLHSSSFQHDWKKAANSLNSDAASLDNAPNKNKAKTARLQFGDLLTLLQYFVNEWKSVCLQPNRFFREQGANESLTDALMFVTFSCGISAFFFLLSLDISSALSIVIGTVIFVVLATVAMRYTLQWLANINLDWEKLAKVVAYSQAPFVVAWLKLGNLSIGWLVAAVCSAYLMSVGMEEIFPLDRQQAIIFTISLSLLIRGILHFLGF
jgi:hypothetical protein